MLALAAFWFATGCTLREPTARGPLTQALYRERTAAESEATVAKTEARSRPNLITAAVYFIADATHRLSGDRSRQPQLGKIYSRLARTHDGRRNPVIVIPGILGSRLIDANSKSVVWGSFGLQSLNPFASQNVRQLALPMKHGVPLRDLRDGVVAENVLDRLDIRLLGFPISVRAYAGILKTLGVGGYRDSSVGLSSVDYGDDHFTCFQFPYDWRRSNVENAQRLDEFIRKTADYVRRERAKRFGVIDEPVRFDLVAHSMGGLVTRYYLRYGAQSLPADGGLPRLTWEGAKHVERLILVGTPNAGSVESLKELVEGVRIAPLLPHYEAAVLGTMPAGYQMLPRPRHRLVVDAGTGQPIDLYDVRVWEKYQWGLLDPRQSGTLRQLLPHAGSDEQRRIIAADHLRKRSTRPVGFTRRSTGPDRSPPERRFISSRGIPSRRSHGCRSIRETAVCVNSTNSPATASSRAPVRCSTNALRRRLFRHRG
ncbi:MAG: hypothetical protein IID45_11770 [Planctomycetes bacterium]|nr:hypothetical protein [Planctomycetota bacterium]